MIKDFNEIRKFPHFAHLTDEQLTRLASAKVPFEPATLDNDELLKVIFAPNPFNGHPMSDFAYTMSKDSNTEIANYIAEKLQNPVPDHRTEDADLAMECVKSRRETMENYFSRLRSFLVPDSD